MADKAQTNEPQLGIFVRGQVLSRQERKGVAKKTGNPYYMLSYMVLCGTKIVSVQQNNAEQSVPLANGQIVTIEIEPSFRDNGVICVSGDVKPV